MEQELEISGLRKEKENNNYSVSGSGKIDYP